MQYQIFYTETAVNDISGKFQYITHAFHDRVLAEHWYFRLKAEIRSNLSSMPAKFAYYDVAPWREQGIHLLLTRQDVVLYSIDESAASVYVHAVCTAGRDLNAHLEQATEP